MEIILFITILIVLFFGLTGIFLFLRNYLSRKPDENNQQAMLLLQNQIQEITKTLDYKLDQSTRIMQNQFGESARIIKEITQELTKVGEGQKQVVDIAKQLESLQDILKNPKQKGVF